MDPEQTRRQTEPADDVKADPEELSEEVKTEVEQVAEIMDARKRYGNDRKLKEREWTESYKMYMSRLDQVLNPFLSNLFIPKTHEAVELLAAFLIGTNQSVSVQPENGKGDTTKALVAQKWLDFLWRKVLKARMKILIWIKQGITFGNGTIKVGWDPEAKRVWMTVCAIEDVYFDFFEPELQDSEYVIHEIRRTQDQVEDDELLDMKDAEGNFIREQTITGGVNAAIPVSSLFSSYDDSLRQPVNDGKVLIVEAWCTYSNKLITLLPTSQGWRIARNEVNPNHYNDPDQTPFKPFIKLRFKPSPVPNRAYDVGAIFPTIRIQKAFNDLINEYFDNVVLVNNKMWVKRRGARINPAELVRRPGGVITVSDIQKDLKSEEIGDVKSSIVEMLNRLDSEFQKASMIATLLQEFSDTATGDSLEQVPLQSMRYMIDENIAEALSELGQMVLAISLQNTEGIQSLTLYETDSEIGNLDFDPKDIDGPYDIKISPDRSPATSMQAVQKNMLDFLKIVSNDQEILARYPNLKTKLYKKYLDNGGVADVDYFFDEQDAQGAAKAAAGAAPPTPKESISIAYKDAPDDIKRQMEAAAGFKPSQAAIPAAPAGAAA